MSAIGFPGLPGSKLYAPIPSDDEEELGMSSAASMLPSLSMAVADGSNEDADPDASSYWHFVETGWFQALTAAVIFANIFTTISAAHHPEMNDKLFVANQAMLCFYVFELTSRAFYYRRNLLCGPIRIVAWNVLDVVVVAAGILDQWLLPLLPTSSVGHLRIVLQLFRLLRLFRVLKIVRVFLDVDLSWAERPMFQSFIATVIAVNSLLMGMEIDIPWEGWSFVEQVLLCIYVFELCVRLKMFGWSFFHCANDDIVWNVLDFVIVASSVVDSWVTPLINDVRKLAWGGESEEAYSSGGGMSFGKVMMLMRMVRLMRILRLVKLVKSVRPLFILVTGVLAALQGVGWVLVLTFVTLYAMGILSTSLIGKKMMFTPGSEIPDEVLRPFRSVPESMFTLFRVMCGAESDKETEAIDFLMGTLPSAKLFFVFFMITSSWTLLSILTAVVSENMISTTGQELEEIRLASAEDDRNAHVARLKEVFLPIDESGDGKVQQNEINTFLQDKNNSAMAAKRCRVPARDIFEVLSAISLAADGGPIDLDEFLDSLADIGNVATEKSFLKLSARMMHFEKRADACFADVQRALDQSSESSLRRQDDLVVSIAEKVTDRMEAYMQGMQKHTEAFLHGFKGTVQFRDTVQEEFLDTTVEQLFKRIEACLSSVEQKIDASFDCVMRKLEMFQTRDRELFAGFAMADPVVANESQLHDMHCEVAFPASKATKASAITIAIDETLHRAQAEPDPAVGSGEHGEPSSSSSTEDAKLETHLAQPEQGSEASLEILIRRVQLNAQEALADALGDGFIQWLEERLQAVVEARLLAVLPDRMKASASNHGSTGAVDGEECFAVEAISSG